MLAWLAKLRPDPLRRLHLGRLRTAQGAREIEPSPVSRTSLPATTGVQQARVDTALRAFSDDAARGLTRGWADAVKAAARAEAGALPDGLDRAIAATDLDLDRHRRWWQLVRVLQWLLIIAVWSVWAGSASALVLAYLRMPPLPEVTWWGFPPPTVLVVGGALAGLVLAALSRVGVEIGARRPRGAGAAGASAASGSPTGSGGPGPGRARPVRAGPLGDRPGPDGMTTGRPVLAGSVPR